MGSKSEEVITLFSIEFSKKRCIRLQLHFVWILGKDYSFILVSSILFGAKEFASIFFFQYHRTSFCPFKVEFIFLSKEKEEIGHIYADKGTN